MELVVTFGGFFFILMFVLLVNSLEGRAGEDEK